MKKSSSVLAVVILNLILQQPCWAWGRIGHKAVAILADQQLSSAARAKLKKILATETLAGLSIWPDQVRPQAQWRHTAPYHYTDINDGLDYFGNLHEVSSATRAQGDVAMAAMQAEEILRAGSAYMAEDRRNALAFLVHFIGDMHQPFHSGRADDVGANKVPVVWFGKKTNLHSVWDGQLISSSFADSFSGQSEDAQARILANAIGQPTPVQLKQWLVGYYDTWLNESIAVRLGPYSGYDKDQEAYRKKYILLVEERLAQAGYRLAAILNDIFDSNHSGGIVDLHKNEAAFRAQLQAIIGVQYDEIVQLQPLSRVPLAQRKILSAMPLYICEEHGDGQE